MDRLESMLWIFVKTTTGVVFVTAVFITVFLGWNVSFGVELLWQDLIVSLVCTVGSIILPLETVKEVSKRSMQVHMILYYIYLNIAVLFCGYNFGWFEISDMKQVLGMLLGVAFVFSTMTGFSYWSAYRTADRMNEKLKERE